MDKRILLFMLCVSLAYFGIHAYFGDFEKKKTPDSVIQEESVVTQNETREESQLVAQRNISYSSSDTETYYVLENDYQQLVFTDRGGSLAEINLPFKSTNSKSIVNEIDFDRQILRSSPQNDHFPLKPYKTYDGQAYEIGPLGGYYPLLRRGLNGNTLPAEYYA